MQQTQAYSLATIISGLACPRCTSTAFHKNGRHLGIQRYKCTTCKRTFNETINTPFHGIHDKQKMQDYLLTMNDHQSIRAASKQIGISVPTSFSWRHRILASLKDQTPSPGTSPAGITEIKIPHSFKGKHSENTIKMPETHSLLISDARGITQLQHLVKNKKTLEAAILITNTLRATATIHTTKTNLLSRARKKIPNKPILSKTTSQAIKSQAIDTANRLTEWMARFNGVATKYLQQYWNWFRAECNTHDTEQFRAECFGQRNLKYYRTVTSG